MTTRVWSLRKRLLLWLLLPLTGLSVVMIVDANVRALQAADHAHDYLLGASALAIAERIVIGEDGPELDLPYVALEMLGSAAQDRVFYAVRAPNGQTLTGYADLVPPPPEAKLKPHIPYFFDARYRGEEVRVVALVQPILSEQRETLFAVTVAQTRGLRNRMARETVVDTALRLAAITVASCAIAWAAVFRGLLPLGRLRESLRSRSPDDLSPLDTGVPREVRHLVVAINQFMERLGNSIAALELFIADASHQLRTPLAGLRTQAELALRVQDPEELRDCVRRMLNSTQRTTRLAEQLLTHARATGGGHLAWRRIDLGRIVRDVTAASVPAAIQCDVDLGVGVVEDDLYVLGDDVLLAEMAANVIDNALRHGGAGTTVTVRAQVQPPNWASIEVEDNGPGIPIAERDAVFARFYRLSGKASGSGLGLAIVRTIVERHRGTITLEDGRGGGLLVRINLPLAEAVEVREVSS